MLQTTNNRFNIDNLSSGVVYKNWEQLRTKGTKAFESIKNGIVSTITVKNNSYKIMHADDFQNLYGLATEVERLQKGVNAVIIAARAVKKHQYKDEDTIECLVEIVSILESSPTLPTSNSHEDFSLEDLYSDNPEDLELDESS